MTRKVSIITVVQNNIIGLRNTYESIRSSLSKDVEWVVVDGASTEGTLLFLNELNSENIQWISDPDRSMYDAMNKGIKLATGEYLLFLNAEDLLLKQLSDTFILPDLKVDLIFYNMSKLDSNHKLLDWTTPSNFIEKLPEYPSINHQSTFIRKELFTKQNYYCEDFKYLGDYEFFCRIFQNQKITSTLFLDTTLVAFICNGVTSKYRLSIKLRNECAQIQKTHYNKVCKRTYLIYSIKYLISFVPFHLESVNILRRFL